MTDRTTQDMQDSYYEAILREQEDSIRWNCAAFENYKKWKDGHGIYRAKQPIESN